MDWEENESWLLEKVKNRKLKIVGIYKLRDDR